MSKLEQLSGTRMTPETLLAMYLERAKEGEFKSVVVTYCTVDDNNYYAGWSNQNSLDLLGHAKMLEEEATDAFYKRSDSEYVPRKEPT